MSRERGDRRGHQRDHRRGRSRPRTRSDRRQDDRQADHRPRYRARWTHPSRNQHAGITPGTAEEKQAVDAEIEAAGVLEEHRPADRGDQHAKHFGRTRVPARQQHDGQRGGDHCDRGVRLNRDAGVQPVGELRGVGHVGEERHQSANECIDGENEPDDARRAMHGSNLRHCARGRSEFYSLSVDGREGVNSM